MNNLERKKLQKLEKRKSEFQEEIVNNKKKLTNSELEDYCVLKAKEIKEQAKKEGRKEYTDEEFAIIVQVEPWRKASYKRDHC